MSVKKKYPQSFYQDGLGDFLEWIDDEVLIHSEENGLGQKRRRSIDSGKKQPARDSKRPKKDNKISLYGENEISDKRVRESKRKQFDIDDHGEIKVDKKLEDRARGLINRLAAQTMPYVTSEFEKLYSSNSRSSVNAAIFDNIDSSLLCKHALAKRKLVAELMLLVSYLDSKVSHGIGGSLIHHLVVKFENLYTASHNNEDKQLDNIVNCIMNLYFIGLISANVVFELTKRICQADDFKAKSVELLLLIVKSVGLQLRKDNPNSMRQFILQAQDRCSNLKSNSDVDARIEFMMEALGAIKNNNSNKLGNYGCDIDKDTIESTLKSLIKRTRLPESLSDASYDEILHSLNWYLLETRADNDDDPRPSDKKANSAMTVGLNSKSEDKICRALGFSKPAEKTIFGALVRVSDYIEASNMIIGFGLNHCSDAMTVCVHVAIHEKKYNLFHYNLINNLCKFNRKYKMAAKFSIQDKIRVLGKMKSERVPIFKTLCFDLVKSDAIPITILKAVEWADLSASTKEFLVYLLEGISELPSEERSTIMRKVDKKSSFAGAMRTFTNCFLKNCRLFG